MTAEDQFDGIGLVFSGQHIGQFFHRPGRHGHVVDAAGVSAVEMGVGREVRAVTGWFPLDVHLFDQATGNESLKAVVDRGHGDGWHTCLGAGIDFIRRGVVPLAQKNAENRLPLGGGTLAGVVQSRRQRLFIFLSEEFHGSWEDELE